MGIKTKVGNTNDLKAILKNKYHSYLGTYLFVTTLLAKISFLVFVNYLPSPFKNTNPKAASGLGFSIPRVWRLAPG